MCNFPNLEKDIERAEREYKRGDYLILEDVLKKEGFVLADEFRNARILKSSSKKRRRKIRKN